MEIVSPDGNEFRNLKFFKLGQEVWLVIPVPEKYVTGGGLKKLRQKSSGHTADLPAKIKPKKINDLK